MAAVTARRYDADCRLCPRLAGFLDAVKSDYPDYFCKPVPPFGDPDTRLLIVGLAPGKHGANASGRPFTGDHAGIMLYETLYALELASKPTSDHRDDGMTLYGCRITNAVKCLPPQNKPVGAEINTCNRYLAHELGQLKTGAVVFALGGIGHRAVIKAFGLRQADYKFAHAAEFELPNGLRLIDSYHCSRYNTQTRRLTAEMFHSVLATAKSRMS